jgi:hypothetical protein
MDGTYLDFDVDILNEADLFVSDVEFARLQRLKAASDMADLGPLDPLLSVDPKVLTLARGTLPDMGKGSC